jgi:enoyl-CoA hydratase
MSDPSTPVHLEHRGDVAVIRLDDAKANAVSHAMIDGINAALDEAEREAKAVALIGREGRFSAGFDLSVMRSGVASARALLEAGANLGLRLYEFPTPVVIGCTGHALAMGAILLFCADVRIGAEGPFKIGMNEVAIGMPVPRFAIGLASDRLSPRALTAAVNLAAIYDAPAAVEAGYLDRAIALEQVPDAAIAEATRLAAELHNGSFRLTREYLRAAKAMELRAGVAADLSTFEVADT